MGRVTPEWVLKKLAFSKQVLSISRGKKKKKNNNKKNNLKIKDFVSKFSLDVHFLNLVSFSYR